MEHFYTRFEQVQHSRWWPAAWAAVGVFDGVHLGHQAILTQMVAGAHAAGAAAVVVTFDPHPIAVLRGPQAAPPCLTTAAERAEIMRDLGVDAVLTLPFDHDLAALSAEDFMRRLSSAVLLQQLWAGADFSLGRNRQGTIPVLRDIGTQLGYSVQVLPAVAAGDQRISSSLIRTLVAEGAMEQAAAALGRPYRVSGPVVRGYGRGKGLGFPTANVATPPEKQLPRYGVYATWTWAQGRRLPSATSVGVRPTFDPPGAPARVEAFLIDHQEDLYDQTVRVEFIHFLRPELRLPDPQALIDQMHLDIQQTREVLAYAGQSPDLFAGPAEH